MRSLPLLIRLAQRRIDDRRLALRAAEQDRLAAEAELAAHDQAVEAEGRHSAGNPEAMGLWSLWLPAAERRRQVLCHGVEQCRDVEARIHAALRDDFAAMKRLEIARDSREKAAEKLAARKADKAAEERELLRATAR